MIIPPDPEKDPNIFSASSSQPSFLLSASGSVSSIRHPEASHGNTGFGLPFPDDLGFGSMGEALPPYEGRRVRRRPLSGGEGRGDSIDDSSRQPTIDIPPRPRRLSASSSINPQASLSETSSSHNPPIIASSQGSSITLIAPSNSKEWESSSLPQTAHRRRFLSIPLPILSSLPIPPRARKWWKQYRRYVHAVLVLLLIGIGLMIGLLVGLRRALLNRPPQGGSQQSRDSDGDGRRTTSWNITVSLRKFEDPSLTVYSLAHRST